MCKAKTRSTIRRQSEKKHFSPLNYYFLSWKIEDEIFGLPNGGRMEIK